MTSQMPSGTVKVGRVGYCPRNYTGFRCDRNVNSVLKNPFGGKDHKNLSREDSIEAFREYFNKELRNRTSSVRIAVRRLYGQLERGININLQCHCTPLPCHCEVIKQYLDGELAK